MDHLGKPVIDVNEIIIETIPHNAVWKNEFHNTREALCTVPGSQ